MVKNPAADAGDTGTVPDPEEHTRHGATKPTCHNYWACTLEPVSHNYWSLHKPQSSAPQEKSLHWEVCALQWTDLWFAPQMGPVWSLGVAGAEAV